MTRHVLQGRQPAEVLWPSRRGFLQAAAAWTAMGGYAAAVAQQRSNIVDLTGEASVNGRRITRDDPILAGDTVATGPGSQLVFVIGTSSFLVRQNSRLSVEPGAGSNVVAVLRLVGGAVASVWNKGGPRLIVTPTLTAGIRGTGVYTELPGGPDPRTYFCNCYGEVELAAGGGTALSRATYHQSWWADPSAGGAELAAAGAMNHTDAEMEMLAKLAGEQTAWQASGRKGSADGGSPMGSYR
jgi:hypothetical protein